MAPSTSIGGITSTENPSLTPRARSVSTSPSARCPKWKSGPTTMRRTSHAPRTRSMNASALRLANSLSKPKTTTASAPASRRSRTRCWTSDSADGGAPGASACIGSGSNVAATGVARRWRAPPTSSAISARWPIWTPSNTPRSTSGEERHRREDRTDEPEVVPLEIPSEEEEGEERERITTEQRGDRRLSPEANEPPGGDWGRDRDLDGREREVRLAVRDDTDREQERREAHAGDRIGPGGAAGVVADDVVVERAEVIHQERYERRKQEERRRPGRQQPAGDVTHGPRSPRGDEVDGDEWQKEERMQFGRSCGGEGKRRRRAPLADEQRKAGEEEEQHEEVVASFDHEREELRIERDRRGHREATRGALHQERHERERSDVGREIEIPLVPDDADMVEEPHERRGDEEHEREVREVIEGRVVDHRPVEHRGVEVIRHVRIHAVQELARRLFDHQCAVVDIAVRLAALAKDDRGDRRHDHERRHDRREVNDPRTRRKARTATPIADRIAERQRPACDEKDHVRAGREELPQRDIARRRDGRVVREEQQPIGDPEAGDDFRLEAMDLHAPGREHHLLARSGARVCGTAPDFERGE